MSRNSFSRSRNSLPGGGFFPPGGGAGAVRAAVPGHALDAALRAQVVAARRVLELQLGPVPRRGAGLGRPPALLRGAQSAPRAPDAPQDRHHPRGPVAGRREGRAVVCDLEELGLLPETKGKGEPVGEPENGRPLYTLDLRDPLIHVSLKKPGTVELDQAGAHRSTLERGLLALLAPVSLTAAEEAEVARRAARRRCPR